MTPPLTLKSGERARAKPSRLRSGTGGHQALGCCDSELSSAHWLESAQLNELCAIQQMDASRRATIRMPAAGDLGVRTLKHRSRHAYRRPRSSAGVIAHRAQVRRDLESAQLQRCARFRIWRARSSLGCARFQQSKKSKPRELHRRSLAPRSSTRSISWAAKTHGDKSAEPWPPTT